MEKEKVKQKKKKQQKTNEEMKEALVKAGHVKKGTTLYKNY